MHRAAAEIPQDGHPQIKPLHRTTDLARLDDVAYRKLSLKDDAEAGDDSLEQTLSAEADGQLALPLPPGQPDPRSARGGEPVPGSLSRLSPGARRRSAANGGTPQVLPCSSRQRDLHLPFPLLTGIEMEVPGRHGSRPLYCAFVLILRLRDGCHQMAVQRRGMVKLDAKPRARPSGRHGKALGLGCAHRIVKRDVPVAQRDERLAKGEAGQEEVQLHPEADDQAIAPLILDPVEDSEARMIRKGIFLPQEERMAETCPELYRRVGIGSNPSQSFKDHAAGCRLEVPEGLNEIAPLVQVTADPGRQRIGLSKKVVEERCAVPLVITEGGFGPWVGMIPWRRKWKPTPVFLPGKSHGQRTLVGYSPWGPKELDMTEELSTTTTSQSFGNMSNIIVFCYKE